jgi:hypothetical protein
MRPSIISGLVVTSNLLIGLNLPAQVVLSGGGYLETFDDLGDGLPSGWSVRTGADASELGSVAVFSSAHANWGNTGGSFKNLASVTGLTSSTTTETQAAAVDRALGLRQTELFGDPGAAFILQIQDTLGVSGFSVSLSAEMANVQGRSTLWSLQYALGSSPVAFTTLTTWADTAVFGATTVSANLPPEVEGQNENLWLRLVALNSATGTGSRDMIALDDFALSYSIAAVPEPGASAGVACAVLLGFAVWRRSRGQN